MREGDLLDGKYHLVRELGDGPYGTVWLAEERDGADALGEVAIKRLPKDADARELRMLSRLQHRRILRYRTYFRHDGRLHIVTDYADGGDVAEALRRRGGPFSVEEVALYLTGLLEALVYLHAEGVGHRDVKPSNLFVVSGEVVLGDVGLAKVYEGASAAHTRRMTPEYAAPEQFDDRPELVSDVYAAGVTAFELLTGVLPFPGSGLAVMRHHLATPPPVPASLPESWQTWLRRSLEKDPTRRWPAAVALEAISIPTRVDASAPRPPPSRPGAPSTLARVPSGYVAIPPGRFWMGASDDDVEAGENEKPRHEVVLTRGFLLKATPVTQAEWRAVLGREPFNTLYVNPSLPALNLRWDDAVAYCNALSRYEGLEPAYERRGGTIHWRDSPGYRLPTEAEWEYACRAGTTGPRYGLLPPVAWASESAEGQLQAVGGLAPNAWGLYDMLGYCWQWCWDWVGPYSPGLVTDPTGPSAGSYRVYRGGSWCSRADCARAAYRDEGWLGDRTVHHGLRPARSV